VTDPHDESTLPRPTHLDAEGRARMVDIGGKEITRREAVATGRIVMRPETARAIGEGSVAKGDVLAVARVAGIQAAKETSRLIPLCHPLSLDAVEVELTVGEGAVDARVAARTSGRTGVEMEALAATYDMCKGIDRAMIIESIRLESKSGGRSGEWSRASEASDSDTSK
jgi:cyclic pyranopterin phosphate synthase